MKKIIVVEPDKEEQKRIKNILMGIKNISISGIFDNALDAIKAAEENAPDIVISEMYMKNLDGLCFMDVLKGKGMNPSFILMSPITTEDAIKVAADRGVDYYIIKPFTNIGLMYVIKYYVSVQPKRNTRVMEFGSYYDFIVNLLMELGLPRNLSGFKYIVYCTEMIIERKNDDISITKDIYPNAKEKFDAISPSAVERGIRFCIEYITDKGNRELYEDIFPYGGRTNKGKPTNAEFLYTIAEVAVENLYDITGKFRLV